ncbi:MAG: pyruvate formate lyase-activating protein [Thermoprotei archaeon]|nr:MAG: pyruvate formate lyase-activating protein [Thermoprotei archaeon]HDD63968.1 radical SAM protein [Thermoprotei archaeon]
MWYILRPDSITVWKNTEVKRRLSHYYRVMTNKRPAKYLIVKRVEVNDDIDDMSYEELWNLHDKISNEFTRIYGEIVREEILPENLDKYLSKPKVSFLDLKIKLVNIMIRSCILCEWRCKVNRLKGQRGACGLNSETRVASYFHHWGEEAPLVPSGTIFFTGCSFKCVFCQNWDISTRPENGELVSPEKLAEIATRLRISGARNINYVGGNPDQHLHTIISSLKYMDINVPLLWNSNFYMSLESMKLLRDIIDIWLPDFKYGNNNCALRLSKVKNYFEVVSRNHRIACNTSDIIIRHLVLPNHLDCCTIPVLEWIAKNCPNALVNVMDQYHPDHLVLTYPERYKDIARRLRSDEIARAFEVAEELGLVFKPIS